ncbi:hypothetical protein TNCV_4191821 [Trichonephila clavipes]|nr:hypothetical protein TNCV_4191821 [Trichonephila clavipes]
MHQDLAAFYENPEVPNSFGDVEALHRSVKGKYSKKDVARPSRREERRRKKNEGEQLGKKIETREVDKMAEQENMLE